jgi:hypothetical protein
MRVDKNTHMKRHIPYTVEELEATPYVGTERRVKAAARLRSAWRIALVSFVGFGFLLSIAVGAWPAVPFFIGAAILCYHHL